MTTVEPTCREIREHVSITSARDLSVLRALSLLVPYDLVNERKIRIGAPGDGGYVLVDRCRPSQDVISFGVGPSVQFESAMATRGHRVFMFDHTVDGLPEHNPRFFWTKEGISATARPYGPFRTLEAHLARLSLLPDAPILKLDIEGDEWDVLAEMPGHVLARFEQIALEVHTLNQLDQEPFNRRARQALGKLAEQFTLCHVHGNNFGYVHVLGTVPVPEALELTYIRKDVAQAIPSTTFYPTEIDSPNFHQLPELRLWYYPFMPGSHRVQFKKESSS